MLIKIMPKLDYAALVGACKQIASSSSSTPTTDDDTGKRQDDNKGDQNEVNRADVANAASESLEIPSLPEDLPKDWENNETLVHALYRVLFDVHLVEGNLVCPDTGRIFPVKQSIPNMILHDDEI